MPPGFDPSLLLYAIMLFSILMVLVCLVITMSRAKRGQTESQPDRLMDWGFGMLLKAGLDVERASRGSKDTQHANALVNLATVKYLEAQRHRHSHHGLVARAAVSEIDRLCRLAIKLAAVDERSIEPMPNFDES